MSSYRVVKYTIETKATMYEKKMFGKVKKHENFTVGYYSRTKMVVKKLNEIEDFIEQLRVKENDSHQEYFDSADKAIKEGKCFPCSNFEKYITAVAYEDRRVEIDFKIMSINDFTYKQIEGWANISQLEDMKREEREKNTYVKFSIKNEKYDNLEIYEKYPPTVYQNDLMFRAWELYRINGGGVPTNNDFAIISKEEYERGLNEYV